MLGQTRLPGSRSPRSARSQRGLHPRPAGQAPPNRVARGRTGADHRAPVRHMVQLVIAAITTRPWSRSKLLPSSRVTCTASALPRGDLATADPATAAGVCRARRRDPRRVGRRRRLRSPRRGRCQAARPPAVELDQGLEECLLGLGERNPIPGAVSRAGNARRHPPQVQLQRRAEAVAGPDVVEHPCSRGVGVDQLNRLGRDDPVSSR